MTYINIYKNSMLIEKIHLREDVYIIFNKEQQHLFWMCASQFAKPDRQRAGEIHLWVQVVRNTSLHLAFVRPDWVMHIDDIPVSYTHLDVYKRQAAC